MTVLWYFWYNFKYKDGPLDIGPQSHKNVLSVHLKLSNISWLEYEILLIENLSRLQFV